METKICKNCGTLAHSNFCPQCGQKQQSKVSISTIAKDVYEAAIDFESPFLKSLFTLTVNPGKLYREYLDGARQRYFAPIRYSLWIMTAVVAIAGLAGKTLLPELQAPPEQPKFAETLETYLVVFNAILIPLNFVYAAFMTIFAKLAFRKEKYTKSELFIPLLLNASHFYLVWLPIIIFGDVTNIYQQILYLVMSVAYMTWGICEMYPPRTFKKYLKSLAAIFLGQVVFSILLGLVAASSLVTAHLLMNTN